MCWKLVDLLVGLSVLGWCLLVWEGVLDWGGGDCSLGLGSTGIVLLLRVGHAGVSLLCLVAMLLLSLG